MRKLLNILITTAITTTILFSTTAMATTKTAKLNEVNLIVNDTAPTKIYAYNIDGFNYFRLRELAKPLDIAVKFNQLSKDTDFSDIIIISPSTPYKDSTETTPVTIEEPTVTMNDAMDIAVNGNVINISTFNLDGYLYLKLADLQQALDNDINIQTDYYTKTAEHYNKIQKDPSGRVVFRKSIKLDTSYDETTNTISITKQMIDCEDIFNSWK